MLSTPALLRPFTQSLRNNVTQRALAALACWLVFALTAVAQPPLLIHYQGRLTNSSNIPITVPTTCFFSIWQGGTATVANQTTELYREQITITPDANGIFNHNIGSGTVQAGALTAAMFNTAQTLYIQVAVTTVGNVLLPRAQITTVGYSMLAAHAMDGASVITGAPSVTTITDTTGGNVVIGDVLQLSGSGLTNAVVAVGGKNANIVSRSATTIKFQVPPGVPAGFNTVNVVGDPAGIGTQMVGQIFVHRLIVMLAVDAANSIIIVDPALAPANQIIAQLNPGFTLGNGNSPIQIGFANSGGVAIIPSNVNGAIRAVDLTANPPVLIGSSFFNTNSSVARSVAVSPDGKTAVTTDPGNSGLRVTTLAESAPPYSNSFFGTTTLINLATGAGLTPATAITSFGGPRGLAFVNDTQLFVTGETSNDIIALRRIPGTNTFGFNTINSLTTIPRANVPGTPYAVRLFPDHTRLVVSTRSDMQTLYLAPEGFGDTSSAETAAADSLGVAIAPDGKSGFVPDPFNDQIHVFFWTGINANFVGDATLPTPTPTYSYTIAAIDPVIGDILAIGTDQSRLELYRRDGGSLTFQNALTIPTTNRKTFALEFQP